MNDYKGIKRGQSKEIFYWLDSYCKDQRPHILNNDIVLQKMVKEYNIKKYFKILTFNIAMWSILIYGVYLLTKG